MKKLFCVLILTLSSMVFAQVPEFAEHPEAKTTDLTTLKNYKRLKDRIRLVSFSEKENISLKIYYFDESKNKWVIYGIGKLKEYSDTDFVDTENEGILRKIKYIAIIEPEGMDFQYALREEHHDLYINVKD